jgi:tetratricopeptide (TPR) repeat protein
MQPRGGYARLEAMVRQGGEETLQGIGTPALADTLASDAGSPPAADEGDGESTAPLVRGETLGRFVVLDVLGTGGVGVVYAAYDPNLDRKVAIKVLQGAATRSSDARLRLLREAQAMARIDHPNVLRVHEAGTRGEQVYIAMEFAGGGTLRRWLVDGKRTHRETVAAFVQAGRGLAAAHAAGLVHRDFKPDNVLRFEDGSVRVTDFGLVGLAGEHQAAPSSAGVHGAIESVGSAGVAGTAERGGEVITETTPLSRDLTRTGTVMGTPAYMSPEQFQGGAVGPAADQFAFCVALYEALYRERPFLGTTFGELCANVTGGALRQPPRDADVPPRLRRVIVRGLSVDPAQRFRSMAELLAALSRDPRMRTRVALAVGAALALAGGGVWYAKRPAAAVCTGASDRLAGVWNPDVRAKLANAFDASHRPDARAVLDRIAPAFDRWGDSWEQGYVGACEDTRVRQIQSEHMLDLRMECLTRRLAETRATLDSLATGGGDAVDHALDAVNALPAVDGCADTTALLAGIAPPETEAARVAIAALRGSIAQARAQSRLGRYHLALAIAQRTLEVARTSGYQPAIAEATLEVGSVELALDDRHSVATLADAMQAGLAAGDEVIAVRAASRRILAIATLTAKLELGDVLAPIAEALAAHAHLPAADMIELDDNIGSLDAASHRMKRARERLERALARAKSQLGPDNPTTTNVQSSLGQLDIDEGKYEDARKLLEQVLATNQRVAGPNHPAVATALDSVASVLLKERKLADVKKVVDQSLAIRIAALGPDHIDVARSYNNLGGYYMTAGDPMTAKAYMEKSVALYDKLEGPDDPGVAKSLVNLSGVLADLGDRDGARDKLQRALAIDEKAYGKDDARIAEVLNDLGQIEKAEQKYDDAIAHFRRAEQIVETVYGPDHPDIARYLGNTADTYRAEGKPAQSHELMQRVVALFSAKFGADHPWVATAYANDGFTLIAMKDYAGALDNFEKARAIFEAKLGKDHPNVAVTLIGSAQALIELDRASEAVTRLDRSLVMAAAAHYPPQKLGEIHLYLSHALWRSPATRPRARTEGRAALAYYRAAHDDYNIGVAQRWIAKHP